MQITFTTPYTDYLNINRAWRRAGTHTYLRPEARAARCAVGTACMIANAGKVWRKDKLFVAIVFYRSDMRSDPDNFVKEILDSIKDVIDVGDNWYEHSMHWQKVKDNPRFEITISQQAKGTERCKKVNTQDY